MSLLYPSVLWIGIPLLALPILIHLLNLRRQRRIRWAAMDFLLQSQRRSKTWILLKQLLLLLTRIAVLAVAMLMLGQLVLQNRWARLFNAQSTHHIVLIDDSYSMTDRGQGEAVFDSAKRVAGILAQQLSQRSDAHLFTLVTSSNAARLTIGNQPEFYQEPVGPQLLPRLEAVLAALQPSQMNLGAVEGLPGLGRLPEPPPGQPQVLYLVSDFRRNDFAEGSTWGALVDELKSRFDEVELIACVRGERPNLAITALAPVSGAQAAGVELEMGLTVANYGQETATNVAVQLEQDGHTLPALVLQEISPGEESTLRFRLSFAEPGAHAVSASLGADAVDLDNRHFFACDLPASRPILIIDGSPDGSDRYYLSAALSPRGPARTGWQPRIERPSFLLDAEALEQYAAVCLLDVPRPTTVQIEALEEYTRNGGGVAFFLGPQAQRQYYDEYFYRQGEGLFPVPLHRPSQLLSAANRGANDVVVNDHPLFRILQGERNSFLALLQVEYYYALQPDWRPPADSAIQVAARLRNGAPLVVERGFGQGRSVAYLTKLSPADTVLGRWNNWSVNPAFPLLMNELIGYLAAAHQDRVSRQVGQSLVVAVPEADYAPDFTFFIPSDGAQPLPLPVQASLEVQTWTAELESVARSGVYRVELPRQSGNSEQRVFAFNVAPGEGDLALATRQSVELHMAGMPFQWLFADEMSSVETALAGYHMRDSLLILLVAMLLGEQFLAYLNSYHPPQSHTGSQ